MTTIYQPQRNRKKRAESLVWASGAAFGIGIGVLSHVSTLVFSVGALLVMLLILIGTRMSLLSDGEGAKESEETPSVD